MSRRACIPEVSWLESFGIEEKSGRNFKLIEDLLPGPITFIVGLRGRGRSGFRIPANSITQKIVGSFSKPIYLSSANISASPPARSAQEEESLGRYSAAGTPITCDHCGGEEFDAATVLLNTTVLTLLDLDWADRKATVLSCRRCGRIQWFSKTPQRRSGGADPSTTQ